MIPFIVLEDLCTPIYKSRLFKLIPEGFTIERINSILFQLSDTLFRVSRSFRYRAN